MMISTHFLAGGMLGGLLSHGSPKLQIWLIFIGAFASLIPDLDMFFEHRRTFHRPFQYLLVFVALLGIYQVFSINLWLTSAVLAGSLWLHSASEILSQSKSLDSESGAVYNHLGGDWIMPKNIVDVGSVKDLLLTLILGIPLIQIAQPRVTILVAGAYLFGIFRYFLTHKFNEIILDLDNRLSWFK